MAVSKWLTWSPETPEFVARRRDGTDETAKTPVVSVSSVHVEQQIQNKDAAKAGSHCHRETARSVPAQGPLAEPLVAEALDEIASLLSIAYQRYSKIPRLRAEAPVNKELALSPVVSVHGHGQPL
jgi:hypothetical protein